MNLKLAYLSQGKLFVKDDDAAPRQIESHFGKEVVERALRAHQKNEWKTKKKDSPFSGSMLWGVNETDPRATRVHATGMSRGNQDGSMYFMLEMETTGGLFLYNYQKNTERRLFHKESFRSGDLDWHPEHNLIVGAQYFPNGTANLIMMNAEGRELRQITEGDSVDEAPSWIPDKTRQIVFQSAGVARNKKGYAVGTGPFAIEKIDLEKKSLTTIQEDPNYDFLLPHFTSTGALYYIRRPYEMPGATKYSPLQFLTDFLLFPFRLLRAIFHYLNFFSVVYSQKPLTTASGPKIAGEDEQTLRLRGRIIDAKKTLREAGNKEEAPSLVPKTWELVQRSPNGAERVVAKGVVAFDIGADRRIIYTNGNAVYQIDESGKSQCVFKDRLIEDIRVLR